MSKKLKTNYRYHYNPKTGNVEVTTNRSKFNFVDDVATPVAKGAAIGVGCWIGVKAVKKATPIVKNVIFTMGDNLIELKNKIDKKKLDKQAKKNLENLTAAAKAEAEEFCEDEEWGMSDGEPVCLDEDELEAAVNAGEDYEEEVDSNMKYLWDDDFIDSEDDEEVDEYEEEDET